MTELRASFAIYQTMYDSPSRDHCKLYTSRLVAMLLQHQKLVYNFNYKEGISNRTLKVRKMPINSQSQEELRKFCGVKFIFSQFEDPNLENFLNLAKPSITQPSKADSDGV